MSPFCRKSVYNSHLINLENLLFVLNVFLEINKLIPQSSFYLIEDFS